MHYCSSYKVLSLKTSTKIEKIALCLRKTNLEKNELTSPELSQVIINLLLDYYYYLCDMT